jgi:hypothetical protein
MGKLVDKNAAAPSRKKEPERILTKEERRAIARIEHPEVFFTVTPEEYQERLKIAKAVEGILTREQADAIRESVREGRDTEHWR